MNIKHFIDELKRRNIFRVVVAYSVAGWLIIQICTATFPYLNLPDWLITAVIVFVLIGFPITLIIAWAFELTPEGFKKSKEVSEEESITHQTGKKINGIIIGTLSAAVVFLLVERVFFAESTIGNNSKATVENASIAVLPFVNMSSDQENEYFSDGLSEELLNALAKVEDMQVAGRTSSFKFKDQNENITEIGKELGVGHILEGSVRKSGNRVRITAQLIKVEDGYHIWSETYDRQLTSSEIFDIQEEISRAVLNELKVTLFPEDETNLTKIPTSDVEAYQLYLKANQLMANRDINEINLAIELYHDVISMDPAFVEAHSKLAIAYHLQGSYGNVAFEEVQEKTRSYADQALLLDNNSGEAYAALGLYYQNASNLEKARDAFLQSLELNNNQPYVYGWLGNVYFNLGNVEKSYEQYMEMYALDPLAPLSIYNRALASWDKKRFEEAEDFFKKT